MIVFFTAKKALQLHIEKEHGSVFEALIQLDKKYTGLSDIQTELLKLFATGAPDKEIIKKTLLQIAFQRFGNIDLN